MRRHLGFVPASHEVLERLTAREFLRFIAALHECDEPTSGLDPGMVQRRSSFRPPAGPRPRRVAEETK